MGRIKNAAIKRVSFQLVDRYGEKFTPDFEANKKMLNELNIFRSMRIRNQVAGYISKIMKRPRAA